MALVSAVRGGLRPSQLITWRRADNSAAEDLTGASITGWIKDTATDEVRPIQGTLTVTDATAGVFRWDYDAVDVATEGQYRVQFAAAFGSDPTPARTFISEWEVAESLVAPDDPGEYADWQGAVRLLIRTTAPDPANAGYINLYAKADGLYLVDENASVLGPFSDGSVAAAAAVAAHVAQPDPHTQYLTESDASSTYSTTAHTHDYAATAHTHAAYAATAHTHDAAYSALAHDHSGTYAAAAHNHDYSSTYAASVHTHDYAASGHNHDSAYSASGHTHDYSGTYAAAGHTHDYAAGAHNHDSAYISVIGSPTEGNLPTITSGGELANSTYAPSSFATAGHDHAGTYAATAHNHDAAYSATGHSHDYSGVYAATAHNHDSSYSATAHNHDSAYSATGHNHSGTYAPAAHAHDSDYISIIGTPTAGNLPTITAGGELANSAYSPSSFAASGHDHSGVYAPSSVTQYTDEMAQDAAASMLTGATHSGASVSYDDAGNKLAITVTDQGGVPKSTVTTKGDLVVASGNAAVARLGVGTNGQRLEADSTATNGVKWASQTRTLTLGKSGALTAAAGSTRLYVPWACTITNVRAMVGTAPTGASLIVDVHKDGTTIFSTQGNRPTITATNFTDLSNTPDVTAIAADAYLTVDVDQIGSTVAGSDLIVQIEVTVP